MDTTWYELHWTDKTTPDRGRVAKVPDYSTANALYSALTSYILTEAQSVKLYCITETRSELIK